MLVPKLFTTLKGYNQKQAVADVTAGVIVGIVALPLAIAFAIGSGVSPQAGLYTAIIAGFLISLLGGSRVQIGGPTGAFVVIVYGIVQRHGVDGLTIATIMAGVILVILGVARLGGAIKFIPHPVVVGFTSGIALIIMSAQVRDFLGLRMTVVPAAFLDKIEAFAGSVGTATPIAAAIAVLTVLIVTLWPAISLATMRELVAPAFAIAMLGGIESLLSAVVADGMIGSRHRSNMELVAQGVANIITPMFGGMPATGAIARTATNVRSGGRTPVAGMVHALTLLLITLFFGKWASEIPMATLAGILVVVAYNMSEWRSFRSLLRAPRSDVVVLVVTFALTVFVDLTVALGVGMVLASFLFMRKMAEVTQVKAVTEMFDDDDDEAAEEALGLTLTLPQGVQIYEIDGPFFFGAAETFKETIGALRVKPKVLMIGLRKVDLLDATGLALLKELAHSGRREGRTLILYAVHSQPRRALEKAGLLEEIGAENCVASFDEAVARARRILPLQPAL